MTVTLFISILTLGSTVSGLLTEAIKKAYQNAKKEYSSNVIALIDSIVVGGGGTAVTYMLMGIPWTVNNVVCLLCAIFAEWLISMLGFDKVNQLLSQLKQLPSAENTSISTVENVIETITKEEQ